MRISDWSSDVCSSDLKGDDALHGTLLYEWGGPQGKYAARVVNETPSGCECRVQSGGLAARGRASGQPGIMFARRDARARRARSVYGSPPSRGDRKSVVEGESVYVRVDLGGRRIIKKKTIPPYSLK